MIKWSCEGSLRNVGLRDLNLMVRRPQINYGEDLRALCFVNQVFCSENGEVVRNLLLVKNAVVNAES